MKYLSKEERDGTREEFSRYSYRVSILGAVKRLLYHADAADEMLAAKDAEIARSREALNWISDPRLHSMHGDPQSLMEKARAALEGKHG